MGSPERSHETRQQYKRYLPPHSAEPTPSSTWYRNQKARKPCLVQKCFHNFLSFYIFQAALFPSEIKNASAVNISGSKNQLVSEVCTVRKKSGDVITSETRPGGGNKRISPANYVDSTVRPRRRTAGAGPVAISTGLPHCFSLGAHRALSSSSQV